VPFGGRDTDLEDALVAYLRLFNLARLPALTHPCGVGVDGMPVAFQLVGRPLDEALLLRVARAYERARGTAEPAPPPVESARQWMHETH
jgi:Asp-tRNA(Asn)/Glu-tRNA(Gln) amidotransferase A subunit family amidase